MHELCFRVSVFSVILLVAECRPNVDSVSPHLGVVNEEGEAKIQRRKPKNNIRESCKHLPLSKSVGVDAQEHRNEKVKRFIGDDQYSGEYFNENSSFFWNARAQMTVRNHLLRQLNYNVAKNVILFLGDGMSIPTLTASRIYLGQKHGTSGEQSRLSFEEFPHIGLSKV